MQNNEGLLLSWRWIIQKKWGWIDKIGETNFKRLKKYVITPAIIFIKYFLFIMAYPVNFVKDWFSKNDKIKHSHVALYIGCGLFIEAYPGVHKGVILSTHEELFHPERTDPGSWEVYRYEKLTEAEKNQIHQTALSYLGGDYLFDKAEQFSDVDDERSDRHFCSELIIKILRESDIAIFGVNDDFKKTTQVYPMDFYRFFKKAPDITFVKDKYINIDPSKNTPAILIRDLITNRKLAYANKSAIVNRLSRSIQETPELAVLEIKLALKRYFESTVDYIIRMYPSENKSYKPNKQTIQSIIQSNPVLDVSTTPVYILWAIANATGFPALIYHQIESEKRYSPPQPKGLYNNPNFKKDLKKLLDIAKAEAKERKEGATNDQELH